jgi:hypothetical protein
MRPSVTDYYATVCIKCGNARRILLVEVFHVGSPDFLHYLLQVFITGDCGRRREKRDNQSKSVGRSHGISLLKLF